MADLDAHLAYLQDEWRAAQAAPLSRRRALLVAALIDAYVDRLFAADGVADDILDYRAGLAARHPSLDGVMGLCARRPGYAITTEAVQVPIADYGALSVADFMVSLYNDHSVQRLMLMLPDGSTQDMQNTLEDAVAAVTDLI